MCDIVSVVGKDGVVHDWVDTAGELARHLGIDISVVAPGIEDAETACMCCVDIPQAAVMAGMVAFRGTKERPIFGDWLIEPKQKTSR